MLVLDFNQKFPQCQRSRQLYFTSFTGKPHLCIEIGYDFFLFPI